MLTKLHVLHKMFTAWVCLCDSCPWLQAIELQGLVRDHFDSFVRCAGSIEKYASHINMELSNNKEQVCYVDSYDDGNDNV